MMCDLQVSDEVGFLSRCAPLFAPSLQAQTFALRESIRCELENLSETVPEQKVLGVGWSIYPRQLLEQCWSESTQCGLEDLSESVDSWQSESIQCGLVDLS